MTDQFYAQFEASFRGTREQIKNRLRVYLPFVLPLRDIHEPCSALDLGCGRGEWLELLSEFQIDAQGVDLDAGMLDYCRARHLSVVQEDLIGYLKRQPDQHFSVITAFHVVEHIHFDDLRTLVAEALRALKPGGLLVMETPNPENVYVGTTTFYMDPTHRTPIPPDLLAFTAKYEGFSRVKLLRLQEDPAMVAKEELVLLDVFKGVSPDYSIVAQKSASESEMQQTANAFSAEYGIGLDEIINRHDAQHALRQSQVDQRFASMQQDISSSTAAVDEISESLPEQLDALQRQLNALKAQMDSSMTQLQQSIQDIHSSTSWRITKPLRWAGHQGRLLRERGIKRRLIDFCKKIGKPTAGAAMVWFARHPVMKQRLIDLLKAIGLYATLKSLAFRLMAADGRQTTHSMTVPENIYNASTYLTPRGREIYRLLDEKITTRSDDEKVK